MTEQKNLSENNDGGDTTLDKKRNRSPLKSKYGRLALTLILDVCILVGSYWLARLTLFYNSELPIGYTSYEVGVMFIMVALCMAMLAVFGCYKFVWKYAGRVEAIKFTAAYVASFALLMALKYIIDAAVGVNLRISLILIYLLFAAIFTGIFRFSNIIYRYLRHLKYSTDKAKTTNTVIIGAGNVGSVLVNRFVNNPGEGYAVVALVDDDKDKQGKTIGGVLVAGGLDSIDVIVKNYKPDLFIIAISELTKSQLKGIYDRLASFDVPIKTLPPISDVSQMTGASLQLHDLKIESLLGRDEFVVRQDLIDKSVKDKVVMVTGGAGSIGSELCRQALNFGCKHLVIFDQHENGMFNIDCEFRKKYDTSRYSLVVGTVREADKLAWALAKFKPDVLFHAAAYKHVPMMEIAPTEAIKNNVFGTKNVIEQCQKAGVKRFVFISTDKAVNPANVMGASKRLAEMLVQTRGADSDMQMAAVRFGNVLGSSGSVIPTFLQQIRDGGPVTVTDRNMKRYFMTIPEAVRLVLQAGALAHSGEVFVLDMGEPVYIYDLAASLIRLNGFVPEKDIKIVISGLRPGEKLFEELRYDKELVDKTAHEGIFVNKLETIARKKFDKDLEELRKIAFSEDEEGVENKVFSMVPSAAREQAVREREASLLVAAAREKMSGCKAGEKEPVASDSADETSLSA